MAPKMLGFVTVFVVIAAAAALITERAEAETYTVGDATGWTDIVDSDTYSSWAAKHTFKVGDTLVFQFTTGRHDVATLTKQAYDDCNNTDLLGVLKQGPVSYSLNETGDYYFICAFPGHCSEGQKLSIKVTASPAAPPPSEAMTPPPSDSKTPPPSETMTPMSTPTTAPPLSASETPPPSETMTPMSPPTTAPSPSDTKTPLSPPTTKAPPPSDTRTPMSPPTTTAPPPSAASLLASTFSTVFMSIAIALLYLF